MTELQYEAECRNFASHYPTRNVTRAVKLAEEGRISWSDLYRLCCRSLTSALAEA